MSSNSSKNHLPEHLHAIVRILVLKNDKDFEIFIKWSFVWWSGLSFDRIKLRDDDNLNIWFCKSKNGIGEERSAADVNI